jgi:hypothetical protein
LDQALGTTDGVAGAAFWVGARLAESYLPELCSAAGISCRPVLLGDAPPVPN